jgi:hypothetical protein
VTAPAEFADRLWDGDPGDGSGAGWAVEAPADEELWGPAPDPDTDPPDDLAAWTGVPVELTAGWVQAQVAAGRGRARWFEPGGLSRPGGRAGQGFAASGPADAMPPGVVLAGLTARAWERSERVSDDELVGIARAWRRLGAWAAAGELAAVAKLVSRRDAQVAAGADPHIAEHVTDEVAAALTLTARAAASLVGFAGALQRLPATRAALWRGEIDQARAWVIADAVTGLTAAHAAAVEAAVIGAAGRQTTGQLRAAARRAVLAADPAAADRRREEAGRQARVETWSEPAGTAALAGRDLPPAQVLAADRRIGALARQLKTAGSALGMDALRARVYTALLLGVPLATLHSQLVPAASSPGPGSADPGSAGPGSRGFGGAGPGSAGPGAAGRPGGEPGQHAPGGQACGGNGSGEDDGPVLPLPPLTGTLNLTMPLATWLGGAAPGDVPGFGPVPAGDARALASLLAATPGSGICLTLTGPDGTAIGHGCARTVQAAGQIPELTFTIRPLARGICGHQHQSSGYRPSDRLRHLVVTRQRTCTFPGCRSPAQACDLDHTVPYEQGGRTCECNLAPLCRGHHHAKQAQGWTLTHTSPGHLTWTLPHGRTYRAGPDPYLS